MDLFTTITSHESTEVPGVRFTVRRLNFIERSARDVKILDARTRFSEVKQEAAALEELVSIQEEDGEKSTIKRAKAGSETAYGKLNLQADAIRDGEIIPQYIRSGLVSIVVDDQESTDVELVLRGAPDGLLWEIYAACYAASDLSEEQRKNSQSPTTSQLADGGSGTPTGATAASD